MNVMSTFILSTMCYVTYSHVACITAVKFYITINNTFMTKLLTSIKRIIMALELRVGGVGLQNSTTNQ